MFCASKLPIQDAKEVDVKDEHSKTNVENRRRFSLRPKRLSLLEYFIYLTVESQKLTCRVRSANVIFSQVFVMTSINNTLDSKLFGGLPSKVVKCVKEEVLMKSCKAPICSENKRKRHNENLPSTSKCPADKNNNNNIYDSRKRRGSLLDQTTSKRVKLQPVVPQREFQKDECELADETNPNWGKFRCSSLPEALDIVKREWGVRHLSNFNENLTRYFDGGVMYRPRYKGDRSTIPCTSIFDSTIGDLHRKLLDVKNRIIDLQRSADRCRYRNRSYYRINKSIAFYEQKKRELKNRLAKVYNANKEVSNLDNIYKVHSHEYQDFVLRTDRFNLDVYNEFYKKK